MTSEDNKPYPFSKIAVRTGLNQDGTSMLAKDDKKKSKMRTTANAKKQGRKEGFGNKVLFASASAQMSNLSKASTNSKDVSDPLSNEQHQQW